VTTNLLISGGPIHDFAATSAALDDVLAGAGVRSTIFDDPHEALVELAEHPGSWDLVTVNALYWQIEDDRHAHLRERWAFTLRDDEAQTIERHVRSGGGLLACHTAAICFDSNPRWATCIGATWNWDRSSHPPEGPARISPTPAGRDHPLTAGIAEFTIVDEIYGFLDQEADLVALLTSRHHETDHPVLWARLVGRGRVVTDLLGHSASATAHREHREILRRAARWLTTPERLDGSSTTP
jgi:uncharacterized protein